MNPLIQCKTTILPLLIVGVLGCFGFVPKAQAVVPPPDGGYPGFNTAAGQNALFNLTAGVGNVAAGWYSLFSNTDGSFNTAVGAGSLLFNTADNNTAIGAAALLFNTTGSYNTANGYSALSFNTEGEQNTATGFAALYKNTTGVNNTATGYLALYNNTEGYTNTANGFRTLYSNITGSFNTASRPSALYSNTTGVGNTAIGEGTLLFNTTGSYNIALGSGAGGNLTTGRSNIDIGNAGVAGESNTIRIGQGGIQTKIFMAGIRGVTTGNGDAINVVIDSNGQLGTMSSSRRFKNEIRPMESASEVIHALKPVKFHYKSDNTNRPEFGLIAEEVAEVNPALVVRDQDGEIYTVRYDAVNAMLLNEFLKEHRKVQELASTVAKQVASAAKQEATIARQQNQIEALTAGLQRVSAQVEASKSAPKIVLNTN